MNGNRQTSQKKIQTQKKLVGVEVYCETVRTASFPNPVPYLLMFIQLYIYICSSPAGSWIRTIDLRLKNIYHFFVSTSFKTRDGSESYQLPGFSRRSQCAWSAGASSSKAGCVYTEAEVKLAVLVSMLYEHTNIDDYLVLLTFPVLPAPSIIGRSNS